MLIAEQSLAETLVGREDDSRRRCRVFIPREAVFTRNELLFTLHLFLGHLVGAQPAVRV